MKYFSDASQVYLQKPNEMSPESTEKIYITNLPIALSEISFTDKSVKKMSLTLELI